MPVVDCVTGEMREHTAEELAAIEADRQAVALEVPLSVSKMQARRYLNSVGKLGLVEGIIAQADPDTQLAYNDAYEFHRNHPFTIAIGQAASLDLDAMFREAKKIV